MSTIKVYIVDDHLLIIEGIIALLQNEKQIEVVGFASNANNCLQFLNSTKVDVLITDINMPEISGIELCKKVKAQHPSTNVIALSTYSEGAFISKMLDSGASGYLLKNAAKAEIIEAIEIAHNGKQYLPFDVQKIYTSTLEKQSQTPLLTKREKEILKLIADGFTNPQISEKLFISIDTVDTHRKNLHTKLNVKNTALLIRRAIENNLLE
ncbi:MAG: response regulator transcription factor [Ferruginibacter sp.]|nr:response regulator transcription factor [Ferruginibacter sp.]